MKFRLSLQPVFRSSWGCQPRPKYQLPTYQRDFESHEAAAAEAQRVLSIIAADPVARDARITMSAHIMDDGPLPVWADQRAWAPLHPFTCSGV